MNQFSICPSCINQNNCVLTSQKDKVWSCSEFDEVIAIKQELEPIQKQKLELV